MAKINGIPPFVGTKHGLCVYQWRGQYCLRLKSSLSGKRVKTSPRFKKTMEYAGLLGRASKIASAVYKALPALLKEHPLYRKLTGQAMQLLKEGKEADMIVNLLMQQYVQPVKEKRMKTSMQNRIQSNARYTQKRYSKKETIQQFYGTDYILQHVHSIPSKYIADAVKLNLRPELCMNRYPAKTGKIFPIFIT